MFYFGALGFGLLVSVFLSCLQFCIQFVSFTKHAGESYFLVVIRHEFQIFDNCRQQVTLLAVNPRRIVLQIGEMYVQVIERRLIMNVDSQLVGVDTVPLFDCASSAVLEISQQWQMGCGEIAQRFDSLRANQCEKIQLFYGFTVPFQIRQQDKTGLLRGVLVYDTVLFLAVL